MRVSKNQVTLLAATVASLFATGAQAVVALPSSALTPATATGGIVVVREQQLPFVLNNAGNLLDVTTSLGIGTSSGQNRYLRFRVTNATFAAPVGALTATGDNIASAVVSTGGATNGNEVIFQVTGSNTTGSSIATPLTFVLPNLNITSNAASVTVSYDVFETLAAAQAGSPVLYSRSGAMVAWATGVNFRIAGGTDFRGSTATAISTYRQVANVGTQTGAIAGFGGLRARVASVDVRTPVVVGTTLGGIGNPIGTAGDVAPSKVVAGVVTAAAFNDIINVAATTNSMTVNGDFSAAASAASISTGTEAASTVSATAATIPFAAGTLTATGFAALPVNYNLNGTASLPASSYTASLSLVANTGFTVGTLGPISTGEIVRDGVQFESPWVTATPGFISRIFVTQTTPADVPYTVVVRNAAGAVTGGTLSGTLPSGRLTRIDLATLLPADTTAVPGPYQVTINIAATAASTTGSYVLTAPNGAVTSVPLYRAANR